jgi:ABC-2 type transport system permease protein
MEFRLDFFFRVVMDVIYYGMNVAFFKVLYRHTDTLAGWSESQVMVFVGAFMVLDGLQMTLFSNNMYMLPIMINRGDLDYYLVRPVSSLFFLSLRDFAANSFLNLVIASGFFAWSLFNYPGELSFGNFLFFLICLANGLLLYYYLRLLWLLPAFWTQSGRGLDVLFWNFTRFLERPDRIFTGPIRVVLLTVLPYALMVSIPTRMLFDGFNSAMTANLVAVTLAFTLLIRALWRLALRNYSSASS